MNLGTYQRLPYLLAAFALSVSILCELLMVTPAGSVLRRLEWITYDWRSRWSLRSDPEISQNLAVMAVDDKTLEAIAEKLGYPYPFPRWVHAAALHELAVQGATGVGYDVFFVEERPGDTMPGRGGSPPTPSDPLFAREIETFGEVFLAAPEDPRRSGVLIPPSAVFSKKAAGVGHARRTVDEDGIARRALPFLDDPELGRVWMLGFAVAAHHLGYNLATAEVDRREIRLQDSSGKLVRIPLDGEGMMMIPWAAGEATATRYAYQGLEAVMGSAAARAKGGKAPPAIFSGRLVMVGSTGSSPAIADRGPTPVGISTPFLFTHFNVANALLTGRFVRPAGPAARLGILCLLVPLVAGASWKLRAVWATGFTAALGSVYFALSFVLFSKAGYWMPMAVPALGVFLVTHVAMVGFRVFVERRSRSRVRGWFGAMMSQDNLDLLMSQAEFHWEPEEREMTVFFADIRGFTAFSDREARGGPENAADPIGTEGSEKETLAAVNAYLATVADEIKRHGATIDKYMGDSVMAFWNAPLNHPRHAAAAVRAAVAAMREVERLRKAGDAGASLELGIALNTGVMTAGVMGSESNPSNYTVFGKEVNVAARLQGAAPGGGILVSAATKEAACRQDPSLLTLFQSRGELNLKGLSKPVVAYEVLWGGGLVDGDGGISEKNA